MPFDANTSDASAQRAYAHGLAATRTLAKAEQKRLGQFMTPPAIAGFMARRAVQGLGGRPVVRVLEPAAGSGVLAAAAVEALLALPEKPQRIELLMCELDERLAPSLHALAGVLVARCEQAGTELRVCVETGDFLLSSLAGARAPEVDLVIANPPYFKLAKHDPRAQAHAEYIWGQPNIYGLFMAACARLLRPGGRYCFITPRSWMSGPYFGRVREHLLRHIHLDALHVFDSRQEHFGEDAVLQESAIVWGSAQVAHPVVHCSTSHGTADLASARVRRVSPAELGVHSAGAVLRVPGDGPGLGHLRQTLGDLGLRVSTGPVVAFRAAGHLSSEPGDGRAPLLWLQHVRPMQVRWPIDKKREHIGVNADSAWMLLPNAPMVLLRRFSPKEDAQRVIAAPYLGELAGDWIGLENHLNYIHSPQGRLSPQEAIGLAAYLNSQPVSDHFAAISGHTQVNAGDLRQLPVPPLEELIGLGRQLGAGSDPATARALANALLRA